jgi:2',3'-cyclic-nucleotide 2'-phosphodiesterase (5'-nucleotidase family)
MNRLRFISQTAGVALAVGLLAGCQTGYTITNISGGRIPITAAYDVRPDSAALAVLEPYQHFVDSIMSPVIGHSAIQMDRHRPESELSNLVADILRQAAQIKTGQAADMAVTNMGGLRSVLPQGEVTYGNIYEITPFENYLTVVRMKGDKLRALLQNIAAVHGEGLSGARLVISGDGKLLSAEVGGKPIDDNRIYTVSTVDYLAEGNDRMTTFAEIPDEDKQLFPDLTLRGLFLAYVAEKEKQGQPLNAKMEGRITVVE